MAKVTKPSKAKMPSGGAGLQQTGLQQANQDKSVSPDQRQRMIAEAAYYRAAQRGFQGGDPVADWLAAEREISRTLPSGDRQKG